jgi:DnaJ-domain-containing protein 1
MKTINFPTSHAQTEFFQSEVGQQALQLISHEGLRLVVEKFSTYKVPVEVHQAFGWELPDHEIRLVTRIFEAWLEAKETPAPVDYSPVGRARRLLKVDANATKAEIKAAWKRAAVANHPDLGGNTEMMQQINAAYELLK